MREGNELENTACLMKEFILFIHLTRSASGVELKALFEQDAGLLQVEAGLAHVESD